MTDDVDDSEVTVETYESYSEYCRSCYPVFSGQYIFQFLSKTILYIFGYSLFSRLFTLILILQAAVLWIGYSLNSVLQLLFIPFLYSSNKSISNLRIFLTFYFILPGIISFASHYFWFIIQFGFHCYADDEIKENEKKINVCRHCSKRGQQIEIINKKDPGHIDDTTNNNDALLCFPQNKYLYRFIITLVMTIYIIIRNFIYSEDIFTALIVSLGLVPLGLMWVLHVMHLFGIGSFVIKSLNDKVINRILPSTNTVDDSGIQYIPVGLLFLIITIVTSCQGHIEIFGLNISYHGIIVFVLFSIYILLYNQTPIKIIHIGDEQICCCCSNKKLFKEKNIFYKRSIFVRFIEKILQSSLSMQNNKQFHIYKLFILIILYVMFVSLNQILTQTFEEYSLSIANTSKSILILLWLPPFFNKKTNQWIIDKQIGLVQFLISFMCLTSLIGVPILLHRYVLNTWIAFIFLLFMWIYTALLLWYYIAHTKKYSSLTVALIKWQKSHTSVSIYMQAFSIMFVLLSLIGFFGFSFGSSIYAETTHNMTNPLSYTKTLSGSFNTFDNNDKEQQQYRMQACYWNFNNFNIQDMTLFAALAYVPTVELRSEIKHFYPNNQLVFDEQFHNYKEYGYGEITYYTLDTPQTVIVVIRGTTLLYEWFIDFDIWTESSISQMISILFPWSRLYPRYVHKIIVNQMSLLESFISDNRDTLKQSPKRFYVKQMIEILEQINIKYKNKPLILVGHSLGGGLAKLAGIALNNTAVVVSISGPGVSYARAKYIETKNILMDTINKRIFNIVHDRDVVPWADNQAGLIQQITCPKTYSRLQCHSINPIFCNFLKNCGNPRNFKINKDICQP